MFNFVRSYVIGRDEFFETTRWIRGLQRFGLKFAFMASKYTSRNICRTVRTKNPKRRRRTPGETFLGDFVDGAYADNADQTEDFPTQRHAIYQAEIRCGYDVS